MARKIKYYSIITAIALVFSGFLLIWGNLFKDFLFMGLGMLISAVVFVLALMITIGAKGETEVDDISLINILIYPLIVGDILTIGSWFDANPVVQIYFLDLGLLVGLFVIFAYIWYLMRERVWSFLEIEALQVDFHAGIAEKQKIPQFLLVSLILGIIYGILLVIFKIFYNVFGYNPIVYTFMGIVFIVCLILSFGFRLMKQAGSKKSSSNPGKIAGFWGTLTAIALIASVFLMIVGNAQRDTFLLFWGILFSVIVLVAALKLTSRAKGQTEVDDLSLINHLLYPLIVGDILTIGSWFLEQSSVQEIWLDLGLIVGLFVIFAYIWYLMKEKVWSFLEIEALHVDFHASKAEKQKMPQFLLVSIILGALYGLLFWAFKLLYRSIFYVPTAIVFIILVYIVCFALTFGFRLTKHTRSK